MRWSDLRVRVGFWKLPAVLDTGQCHTNGALFITFHVTCIAVLQGTRARSPTKFGLQFQAASYASGVPDGTNQACRLQDIKELKVLLAPGVSPFTCCRAGNAHSACGIPAGSFVHLRKTRPTLAGLTMLNLDAARSYSGCSITLPGRISLPLIFQGFCSFVGVFK